MTPLTNRHWSVPQTIMFATEVPANEQVYAFALAQAKNAHAKLISFTPTTRWSSPPSRPAACAITTTPPPPRRKSNTLNPWRTKPAQPGLTAK